MRVVGAFMALNVNSCEERFLNT